MARPMGFDLRLVTRNLITRNRTTRTDFPYNRGIPFARPRAAYHKALHVFCIRYP